MRKAKWRARLKFKLGLPDLEQAKTEVLVSLRSPESQRSYQHSIDDFVLWYCSEPRLSFSKTVVTRYRIHLESRQLAPGTINVRLAAVRRLAYEAADSGLLSPELAAGIRGVKGSKKLGIRLGNWLTVNEARALWQLPDEHTPLRTVFQRLTAIPEAVPEYMKPIRRTKILSAELIQVLSDYLREAISRFDRLHIYWRLPAQNNFTSLIPLAQAFRRAMTHGLNEYVHLTAKRVSRTWGGFAAAMLAN